MALETWLTRVKSAIRSPMHQETSQMILTKKSSNVGILAFEIAGLMSKIVHLWQTLSDSQISRLRHEIIALEGIRKVVSDDDAFLLGLAFAELTETLRLIASSTSNLSKQCTDQELRRFDQRFKTYADSGADPNRWAMNTKEMKTKVKKMDRLIASTATLYKEMDELADAEHGLKKMMIHNNSNKITTIADVQQKIFWKKQEIKYLRPSSLWGSTFDSATLLLSRSIFTILARIKHVFGIETTSPISHSPSVSSAVHPDSPLKVTSMSSPNCNLFELSSSMITPPESTLGAAALAMQYANVINVIEKMIRTPRAVGPNARDDLYSMLPKSVRVLLRNRLRGVGWGATRDEGLAEEWRVALCRIVEWIGPLAHNTIRWQGETSFERRNTAVGPKRSVLLLQTLWFANREKVEAAVAELLVGLNYVWRFEVEMCLNRGSSF